MRLAGSQPGLARDTLVSLLAIAVVGGSTAVYNISVGRALGEARLGQAALSLALGIGAAQIVVAGIGPATTRFAAARTAAGWREGARDALVAGIGAAVGLGSLTAVALLWTAGWWSDLIGLKAELVSATAALVALQAAYLGFKAGLYGLGLVARYAVVELLAGAAFLAALVLVLRGGSVSLVAPFLAANVVFLLLAVGVVVQAVRSTPEPAGGTAPAAIGGGSMPHYALIATVGSAAALARLSLPALVTGAFWPAAEVGLLQAALSFLLLVMLVPRALELALFPSLAGAFGRSDGPSFRANAEGAIAASALVLGPVAGVLLVLGPDLLTWLFGPPFAAAAPALVWVVVAAWALGLAVPAVSALSGADGVAVPNAAAVLGLLASVAYWLWRVPAAGAVGAAEGLAVGSLVTAAVPLAVASRRYGLRLRRAATTAARAAALTAAAWLAVAALGVPSPPAAAGLCAAWLLVERRAIRLAVAR